MCSPEVQAAGAQVAMLPMQNALYQAAVNNFRSQAAAARRRPAPKSGAALAPMCFTLLLQPCP